MAMWDYLDFYGNMGFYRFLWIIYYGALWKGIYMEEERRGLAATCNVRMLVIVDLKKNTTPSW
jgi:hypothetical protein